MKRTFTFLLTALFLCVGMVKAAVTDVPEMSTEGNTVWYTISNTRSASGKYLYWTEAGLKDANTLSKASLFYFTAIGGDSCLIHNAATELLFSGDGAWTAEGVGCVISETPHSSKAGVAIEFNGTALNEQNYADGFTTWSADDAGSIFVISPATVSIEEAIAKLEVNKAAGNTIMGEYKYDEESYNALVTALEVLKSASGEEAGAAFEKCLEIIAGISYVMPEEGKFYLIECPLFKNVQGVSKGLNGNPSWNTINLADKSYYWTVEIEDGAFALKNVGTGTYLNGTSMSEAPAYAQLNPLGEQQFNIVVNGTTVHAEGHGGGAGKNGNLVHWGGGANTASGWQFIERVDPSTLVEATVTYSFTYEGEEKYTQTTTTFLGEEWPAITVAFPFGVSASKPEGVVEVEEVPTTFYVKNALSGQYLSYDVESNLTVADAEAVATIVPSSVVAGTFAISYPGPNGAADPRFVQCGSKGRFSGNAQLTENSSVYLYKVTGEGAATRVNAVEDGASYVFVAKCSKADYEGYWMITNELVESGANLRMIGVKASDELADEITFEVGDYSPVWTVGVAEVEEVAAAEFYVKNAVSGKYLDFDPASNLTTGDAEAVATIVPSSLVAGTFAISYPDPDGQTGVRYVQSGSSGRFSGNAALTKNSSIYVYKVASESTATRVEAIEDGASYIFVSESTKGGYWMLTNEPYKSGVDLRMIGVKVSDELPGDEITYEQGAEFSPVWTVEAVKEEPAAVAFTKVIELEVAELPFVAAETVEGISKWYYTTMHNNPARYIQENLDGSIDFVKQTVGEVKTDSLLWGFVGNHFDGIKLVNKATGHAVVSTSGDAKMGDAADATVFALCATNTNIENGFCLKYPEGGFLNGNAGAGKVSTWSAADQGSTFRVFVLPMEELAAFAAKFNELESLTEAYTSMYAISAVQNQFFAVYDAVAPVKEAIENGTATSEEVVAATASMTEVIAFVLAMDAKYNEWKAELMACYEVQDTTVTENVAAVAAFSAVVDKHSMYQWMMPAESVEDFDALIAELVAARESFIAAANTPMTPEMEAFLAKYGELEMVTEACPSLWFISVLNEKFYELIDAGDALKAKLLTATAEELSAFGVLVDEFIAFAQSMDAKYNEWKTELMACYEVQDTTTTASEEAVAAFAEVLDKHSSYQWGMPATSVEDIDALIAELVAARKAFIDDATGINNINVNVEAVIYDIHGRRVSTMEKGIYIVNGRKVIVK